MNATDWSVVDDEPWPDYPAERLYRSMAGWLLAFWAVLAALVFVVVVRRVAS